MFLFFFFKGKQIKNFKIIIYNFFFSSQGVPGNTLDSEWRRHYAHEALFGCSHLGCLAMMPVASYTPIPFSTPCDDMFAMLVYATR